MDELLQKIDHRPWPPPEEPWVQKEAWCNILFAHWRVAPEALGPLVPAQLELDLWDGSAWVGITPFCMTDVRPRGLPPVPGFSTFPQVDLRTYVRHAGRPGVFYIELQAPSELAVWGARTFYHMAYSSCEVHGEIDGDRITVRSRRESEGEPVLWNSTHWPASGEFEPRPGTIEEFLIDRWTMFTVDTKQKLHRVEIHRLPWPITAAEVEIRSNTLARAHGLDLEAKPESLYCSRGVETLIWPPVPAG